MQIIEVGKLFAEGITEYTEMPEYNYRSGSHRLIIAMAGLSAREIEAVKSGDVKFAFTVIRDVLVLQYRFGSVLPWSDATYTWHKVPANEQVLPPEITGQQRATIEIFLIEATTGIVKAIRLVSFSPTFTKLLHKVIRGQAARPFPSDYDYQVQAVFRNYTSAELRKRALASCNGGDGVDRPATY